MSAKGLTPTQLSKFFELAHRFGEEFKDFVVPGKVVLLHNIAGQRFSAGGIALPQAQQDGKNRNADRCFWGMVIKSGTYRDRNLQPNVKEAKEIGWDEDRPLEAGRLILYHHHVPIECVEDGTQIINTWDIQRVKRKGDLDIASGPIIDGVQMRYDDLLEYAGLRKV